MKYGILCQLFTFFHVISTKNQDGQLWPWKVDQGRDHLHKTYNCAMYENVLVLEITVFMEPLTDWLIFNQVSLD